MRKIVSLAMGAVLVWGMVALGEVIKIEFNTLFHEADAKAMEEIIDLFNASHTNIQVELIQGRWAQYYAELRLSVIAGTPPQLGICHVNRLVEVADYLTPLEASPVGNLIQIGGINPADFPKATWDAGELAGHHYLIPLDTHGWGLWYNKDIFVAAGLDPDKPPQTMGEFMAACEAIKAAGYYAFHPAEDSLPRKLRRAWEIFFYQMGGGALFDEGYTKATFNNPAGLLALQFLVDIFNNFGWNIVGGNGYNQFTAGRLGMLFAGNWFYPTARDSGVNWGYAKVPNFFGTPYTWGASHQLSVPLQPAGTSPAVYQATMEVARFVVEHSHIWTMSGGHIAANRTALKNPALLSSDYWTRSGHLLDEMIQQGLVKFPINHPRGSELEKAIETYIELAVNGKIAPAAALAQAEAECNKILQGR
ncbi:MAG: extracellular solute-binding protein [Candidatus Acetothermia bacterium]|nr:extracellular solute-binding protein [Candidatus Acetothermia bacterium]